MLYSFFAVTSCVPSAEYERKLFIKASQVQKEMHNEIDSTDSQVRRVQDCHCVLDFRVTISLLLVFSRTLNRLNSKDSNENDEKE